MSKSIDIKTLISQAESSAKAKGADFNTEQTESSKKFFNTFNKLAESPEVEYNDDTDVIKESQADA